MRARLAEYWNERFSDFLTDQDRSASELVRAVLVMAGLKPTPATRAIVSTVPALIHALGGRYRVAEQYGVEVADVVFWERKDFIPAGWHYRFARHARKRGYSLADDLFG